MKKGVLQNISNAPISVIQEMLNSPEVEIIEHCILLPPSAVPHISQPPVPKSRGLTASPRGEKPCSGSNMLA